MTDRARIIAAFSVLRTQYGFYARMIRRPSLDVPLVPQDEGKWVVFHHSGKSCFWISGESKGDLCCRLYLSWGTTVEDGFQIVGALRDQGLKVEWTGNPFVRIAIIPRST